MTTPLEQIKERIESLGRKYEARLPNETSHEEVLRDVQAILPSIIERVVDITIDNLLSCLLKPNIQDYPHYQHYLIVQKERELQTKLLKSFKSSLKETKN